MCANESNSDRQRILNEIRRTAQANGGTPVGRQRFENETGIRFSDWCGKYWRSWGYALREAGFQPNSPNKAYPEDYLIGKLVELIRELRSFPVSAELRMKARADRTFPSHSSMNKLGKKAVMAHKAVDYCRRNQGLDDVIAICEPLAIAEEAAATGHLRKDAVAGFVYLLKSGRYYKIGRSNSVGRREYELRIALPEKPRTIHKIATDDPAGIEQYWHSRFSAKRKDGEWFDLSPDDIQAFKRRKFM